MPGLYKDRYRIDSTRLQKWDYSTPACYFITICTKDRFCWFGHIINKKTVLSDPGRTVNRFWLKIPDYFNHVISGRFVVMPNHIHGILILKENGIVETRFDRVSENEQIRGKECKKVGETRRNRVSKPGHAMTEKMFFPQDETRSNRVSTGNGKIESTGGISGQKNLMLNNSISRVIRWYKGRCTHEIRKLIPELYFQWQPRFYDHIIRNENEYYQISNYIRSNPANWPEDKYYNI